MDQVVQAGQGRKGRSGRNTYGQGIGSQSTGRYRYHYCYSDQHLKHNCAHYKKERGELWCNHCNTGGHDDGMCFKLHPDQRSIEGWSRQLSKFKDTSNPQGGGDTTQETSNATVDVILCVVDMNEEEESYYDTDGGYDSSDQSKSMMNSRKKTS